MPVLRQAFESLGFTGVTTVAATGNVTFEAGYEAVRTLENKIGEKMVSILGYAAPTFIRTPAELAEIAAYEAFPASENEPSAEHNIIFLSDLPDEMFIQRVAALQTSDNQFRVYRREIYWLRRKKPEGTYFSTVPVTKAIEMPFTVRGDRIVKLIAERYMK